MSASTHRRRAVALAVIAVVVLLLGFAAGWVGKVAAEDRAKEANSAAKAVADPVVATCEENSPEGKALRADDGTCERARQVQKAAETGRQPVLVPVPGPEGPRGFIGPIGPDGGPGENGRNGEPGTNGTNGTDGLSGAAGTDGTSGVDGTNGESGTNGMDGSNGADGNNGQDATDAQINDSVARYCSTRQDCAGKTGDPGTDGVDGVPGATGPSGPAGVVATGVSPGCSDPSPLALMTFNLVYDPATQTITLVCERS